MQTHFTKPYVAFPLFPYEVLSAWISPPSPTDKDYNYGKDEDCVAADCTHTPININ